MFRTVPYNLEETQPVMTKIIHKSVQKHMTKKFRSKANQTQVRRVNKMTSPLKPHIHSVSTSPLKINQCFNSHSSSFCVSLMRKISSVTYTESSRSTKSLQMESTSDCSEMIEDDKQQEDLIPLDCTLKKIKNNPHFCIGVPISCYYLINLVQEQTNIASSHILLCLKKVRLNTSFSELADDFAMDTTYASKIFFKNIPLLASVISPFIVKLSNEIIKRNLPMVFRHKYNKVSCLIDCIEIEVQKSSDYKQANTIKYLVSFTPNGLVNYISPGFEGRITDTCLIESCDFIKSLQPGTCVMADRGFKHVEMYFRKMGVVLVRPPSVTFVPKLSKTKAKQIASLRMHNERVIRRLREFNMIKPHSCLNLSLVKVLDDVMLIACGLINLQDSL